VALKIAQAAGLRYLVQFERRQAKLIPMETLALAQ
jgi:hypothetical protein